MSFYRRLSSGRWQQVDQASGTVLAEMPAEWTPQDAYAAEQAALARETAAFRWLADGLMRGEIEIDATGEWPRSLVITMLVHDQEWREVAGDTLLEVCEKAMAMDRLNAMAAESEAK